MTDEQNPLSEYFRTPALYLSLPSEGEYYPDGSLEITTENGDVAVYPMTARDEIALNTPDALYSGSATAQVIESCVPSIKNGFDVPTTDVDPILIAIRIATYGEEMSFTNVCPSCSNANDYEIDLKQALEHYKKIDYSQPHKIDQLTFYFKPQLFRTLNKVSLQAFEEQRALSVIENTELPDDMKVEKFSEHVKKISNTSIEILCGFIDRIVLPDGNSVDNLSFVIDFINNCDNSTYKRLEEIIEGFREKSQSPEISLTCKHCGHNYMSAVTFESSNFFG